MTTGASGWRSVDTSADPAAFVRYLDRAEQAVGRRVWTRARALHLGRGDRVLDLGCGTGADARVFAKIVGRRGTVIGVDRSSYILDEARQRSRDRRAPIYVIADAHALPFRRGSFDACSAERVLIHLAEPARAAKEMFQVLDKAGGCVAIGEPDFTTVAIDGDSRVTAAILSAGPAFPGGGFGGRQLRALLVDAGFRVSAVAGEAELLLSLDDAQQAFNVREWADRAAAAGVVTDREAAAWLDDLVRRDVDGRFVCAWLRFTACGERSTRTRRRRMIRLNALLALGALRRARARARR